MRLLPFCLLIPLGLAACADIPELQGVVPPEHESAAYPALVPAEQILGTNPPDFEADAQLATRLEARAAGLQARATRLSRTPAIDPETRRRLDEGVQTE